ncbi:MAG: hypothetical protein H2172_14115 [Opitutus sp.]|jgi:hypothetical protein|nr:hypothetical protein [Opitutus sp.]MCS6247346.1 hypothetical protein [Opitutus sp.]MCS6275290.1 hypothetical protein [Opitutus sp.]MCS6277586.1 hypothetical protein [Opitutus sp.]MCS6300704.1 hypothetical protein [Opitutus sp.]
MSQPPNDLLPGIDLGGLMSAVVIGDNDAGFGREFKGMGIVCGRPLDLAQCLILNATLGPRL